MKMKRYLEFINEPLLYKGKIYGNVFDLSNKNLIDLSGITIPEYITELIISNNLFKEIKDFPNQLELINCYKNNINSIVNLPENLEELNIPYNHLKELNISSNNMVKLTCSNNRISNIIKLPENLKILKINNNKLNFLEILGKIVNFLL